MKTVPKEVVFGSLPGPEISNVLFIKPMLMSCELASRQTNARAIHTNPITPARRTCFRSGHLPIVRPPAESIACSIGEEEANVTTHPRG
jgi:hypothetical protein